MTNYIAIQGLLNTYIKDRDLEDPEVDENNATAIIKRLNYSYDDTNARADEELYAYDNGYDAGYMQGLVDALDVIRGVDPYEQRNK